MKPVTLVFQRHMEGSPVITATPCLWLVGVIISFTLLSPLISRRREINESASKGRPKPSSKRLRLRSQLGALSSLFQGRGQATVSLKLGPKNPGTSLQNNTVITAGGKTPQLVPKTAGKAEAETGYLRCLKDLLLQQSDQRLGSGGG